MKTRINTVWVLATMAAILIACAFFKAGAQQKAQSDSGFESLYSQAQSAMAAGRFEKARADFEHLKTMQPNIAEVHASLGALDFQMGDYDKAIEEIHAARRLKPTLKGLDTLLALSLAESGKYKDSLPGLEKAFHSDPDPALKRQAGLELARIYSYLSMDRKAVEVALELRDLYKDDPEVLYNVGKILGNSAYLTMQDLFHGNSGSVWIALAEAEAHESQGQFASAIASYKNVLEIDPRRVNVHYRIGRTFLAQWETTHSADDIKAAENEFELEIAGNPNNANADYELALLRQKESNDAAARQLYESAIHSYPDFEEAEVGLGGVFLDQNQAALALTHLKRATEIRPDDEVAWYRLAQANRMLGDSQAQRKALAEFQKLHSRSAAMRNKDATQSQDAVTPQKLGAEAQQQ